MDWVTFANYSIAFISLFSVVFFLLLFLKYRKEMHTIPKSNGWEPTVSIIIPAYNESEYISDSLRSVLSLNYPKNKLEIIVVDDASTDNTLEIVKRFESSNVRVFTKKNAGKGAALNYGIAQATGEVVATMDADSYLKPDTLRNLLPLFDGDEVMAVTPAVKIKEGGGILKELQRVEYMVILFSRKVLSYIDAVPVTPGPFSIFRKKVFSIVGGFDERNLVEDQEIALRIQAHNFKIRSSIDAEVITEPPLGMKDLILQRVRWQRGGIRNYWKYRSLISPTYGDFGMFFIPMNFVALIAFFLIFGIMIYSMVTAPYYTRYIWVDSFSMGIDILSIVAVFVVVSSILFTFVVVSAFKNEKVKLRYILGFSFFYWYLMVCYNLLTLWKEIRRESFSW